MIKKEKDVTIYDVAKALNISPSTVSRGLKDCSKVKSDTRKLIVDTAKEMGYRTNIFASNLRVNSQNTIGVIVPRISDRINYEVIAGIERITSIQGYNLIIAQSLDLEFKEQEIAHHLYKERINGLIISPTSVVKSIKHLKQYFDNKIPVVTFGETLDHPNCAAISIENFKAAYIAVKHLISQGCKRIAHITGPQSLHIYSEHARAYRETLTRNLLPYNENLLFVSDLSDRSGVAAADKILSLKQMPDGVFVSDDKCAISCIRQLQRHGIQVPKDIAFVGFSNDPLSLVIEPNLSTIDYGLEKLGELAATTMISLVTNMPEKFNAYGVLQDHQLLIRDSSLKSELKSPQVASWCINELLVNGPLPQKTIVDPTLDFS